jgi:hypothetical protein
MNNKHDFVDKKRVFSDLFNPMVLHLQINKHAVLLTFAFALNRKRIPAGWLLYYQYENHLLRTLLFSC